MRKIPIYIHDDSITKVEVYYDKWNSEYQVRVKGRGPESTHYTDCKDDAIATASAMHRECRLGGLK